jgi:hypothetical protein
MSTHIIFATRRSAAAVGSMQKHSFRVGDLECRIAFARRRRASTQEIDSLKAELKHAQKAAKAARTRFERAQRDLSWG